MDELVDVAKEALLKTVDLLTTELRIHSWDFLPYEAYAIVLAYIFAKRGRLSAEDVGRVRRWFWTSAFSERYRGASEHFVSRDLEAIDAYVISGSSDVNFGSPPSKDELTRLTFRANNSRSRAYILLLAALKPRNLTNGVAIDPAEALSAFNKKQFHHIYPKAHLGRTGEDTQQNSLLNICMLAASENNWISDQDPTQYLPRLTATLGMHANEVFASNLLPSPDEVNYAAIPFDEFLARRADLVHPIVVQLCDGRAK